MTHPSGATTTYYYTGAVSGDTVERFAACVVPATESAATRVSLFLGLAPDPHLGFIVRDQAGRTDLPTIMTDPFALDPIEVIVCQYDGTYPDCEDEPGEGGGDAGDSDDDYTPPPSDDDPPEHGGGSDGDGGSGALPGDDDGSGNALDDGPFSYAVCISALVVGITVTAFVSSLTAHNAYAAVTEFKYARREYEMLKANADSVDPGILYAAKNRYDSAVQGLERTKREVAIALGASLVTSSGAVMTCAAITWPIPV